MYGKKKNFFEGEICSSIFFFCPKEEGILKLLSVSTVIIGEGIFHPFYFKNQGG